MPDNYEEQLASNLYFDRNYSLDAVKVLPGEYYVTSRDMVLVTVLGSCVAACIRDYHSGIGGMNHFMLPDNNSDDSSPLNPSARYGTYAMEILINHITKLGARRAFLEAKVFGGGNVLKGFTVTNVGQRNADFVLKFLSTEKIRIGAQDLVDIYPRKVYYFPNNGKVMGKKLRNIHNDTVIEREKAYGSRLKISKVGGDGELFG